MPFLPLARHRAAITALLALAGFTPSALAHSYGETLLSRALHAYPAITGLRIEASDKIGQPIIVMGGAFTGSAPESVALNNAMGERIGTLIATGRHSQRASVADWLTHHIYVVGNLSEDDPFVAGAHSSPRAQAIVERMLAADPALVTLAFHVGASGAANRILASSFGRIGKPGDADDARVIDQGAVLRETTNQGRRFAVELPLLDRQHRVVGALSVSYRAAADGADGALLRATRLRDAIARRIASLDAIQSGTVREKL